ncbi:MAG: VWA domain-containing protein [Anaerolineae bacterium]
MPILFPFTAIVRQEQLKRALILNAISPAIGGVLIRGERGTAKSTAARALALLLPDIEVVADCPFSCDPADPAALCSVCHERVARGETLPRARRRVRFVELPVSATEDRVVGTLDISQALQTGERRFEPGVLAAANRGILYIDEVNLLDDHVVDLLLDVAAMGVNVVEREGISFNHPARFILVGTMNPEEGELRPQLLDRFALLVTIHGITDAAARAEVLARRLRFEHNPAAFYAEWEEEGRALAERIASAQRLLPRVRYTPADLRAIAELTAGYDVAGHRADLAILKAALAHAAFDGRTRVADVDVALSAELALPHRMRREGLQDTPAGVGDIESRLAKARRAASISMPSESGEVTVAAIGGGREGETEATDASSEGEATDANAGSDAPGPAPPTVADRVAASSAEFRTRRLTTTLDRITRHTSGRRSDSLTQRKRGHYVASRPGEDAAADLALDATLRAAAPFQRDRWARGGDADGRRLLVEPTDYRRKIRTRRVGNMILFAVDASWSMAAGERIAATKGAVLSLLRDAYQRRDRVGVLVFRRDEARLILPFTNSVERAQRALTGLPIGGKTPLAHALLLAYRTFQRARQVDTRALPLLILLTDGAGNVPLTEDMPPEEEVTRLAYLLRQAGVHSVVIDAESSGPDGAAHALADALGGHYFLATQLRAEGIVEAVSREVESFSD